MKLTLALLTGLSLLSLNGCKQSGIETGNAGGLVTGAAGQNGSKGETRSIEKCDAPIATLGVMENPNGYTYTAGAGRLPESPVPLVRLMLQQSGCFRVVDRNLGLKGTKQELDLQESGLTRKETTVNPRGNVLEAQYVLTPTLVFSEQNAGGELEGILARIPVIGQFAGLADKVKFKEAQVVLTLTDTQTTEQLVSAEGSAKATDLGAAGLIVGLSGGAGMAGWTNTNEGKVISAAFLDSVNKLIPHVRELEAKAMPARAATRPAT
ncbi:CsgG/HfaB family protein [Chitinimonas sp. BJYL2]|uniref:CsgG/HfaB family protein n=1 Tax=Chitinimonas sp. BJYL2 TaxID=2976696 RepID=UPI0022B461CD|nr:CsgG/HfaB family protein [Chitinimonas sp. BJYL2]